MSQDTAWQLEVSSTLKEKISYSDVKKDLNCPSLWVECVPKENEHGKVKKSLRFLIKCKSAEELKQVRERLSEANLKEESSAGSSSERPDSQFKREKKPYGFVALPENFRADAPIWHDGSSSEGKVSGEIRCELRNLTPLLVGWERANAQADESKEQGSWSLGEKVANQRLAKNKPVLTALQIDGKSSAVILPGDSLKGFLRHELGALLGAPMERVDERSYSYRPNAAFTKDANPRLQARIARVIRVEIECHDGLALRIPVELEVLDNLKYRKSSQGGFSAQKYRKPFQDEHGYYTFDVEEPKNYRGGLGAGKPLNSKKALHHSLSAFPSQGTKLPVPADAKAGYVATVRHLVDTEAGHFSRRHPDVPKTLTTEDACERIRSAVEKDVFGEGDYIWVEYDTEKKRVVSFGWNYYYRWAYIDTVRSCDYGQAKREGLFPLAEELEHFPEETPEGIAAKGEIPRAISAVRRLFGYTSDKLSNPRANLGNAGIGRDDYSQLMGRLFVNSALEQPDSKSGATSEQRFLGPTYLKELGMPRPSAVEHYLKQDKNKRRDGFVDKATLVTYGDAKGYDTPGELAGRKFYLDRKDAYTAKPWEDNSQANKDNERATLALNASQEGRLFRFTVRFRDLEPRELAAVLIALAPNQFHEVLGGTHKEGYCSKLGYAKPLGWGSVQIEAKEVLLLDVLAAQSELSPLEDIQGWVRQHHQATETQEEWLAIHRCKHPEAADYPRSNKDNQIFSYHTELRAEHSRQRRYRRF